MNLDLAAESDRAFAFLLEHGFLRTQTLDDLVRYSSESAFVDVVWSRKEFLVDARIGRITPGRQAQLADGIPLYVVLRADGVPEDVAATLPKLRFDGDLRGALDQLADQIRLHGKRFLLGDDRAFANAKVIMRRINREREEAAGDKRSQFGEH